MVQKQIKGGFCLYHFMYALCIFDKKDWIKRISLGMVFTGE